jgi:hypothetical protein
MAIIIRQRRVKLDFQGRVFDEPGRGAELRLRVTQWRRPSEGAIALRFWMATHILLKSQADKILANDRFGTEVRLTPISCSSASLLGQEHKFTERILLKTNSR